MGATFELVALQAQLYQEKKDRLAAEQAATDAKKRAEAARALTDQAQADLDARIKADTGSDDALRTEGHLQWLEKR